MTDDPFNAVITWVDPGPVVAGPLAGRRLLVKDLIDTAGVRTTYGSQIFAEHVPDHTAPSVERLLVAGAPVEMRVVAVIGDGRNFKIERAAPAAKPR